jgi:hypothetical protein
MLAIFGEDGYCMLSGYWSCMVITVMVDDYNSDGSHGDVMEIRWNDKIMSRTFSLVISSYIFEYPKYFYQFPLATLLLLFVRS